MSGSPYVSLVVEDDLSESVLRRILNDVRSDLQVDRVLGNTGFGYIKANLLKFNRAAAGIPFIILADLDNKPCAPGLVAAWSQHSRLHSNILFRVAVREVESWLLADRGGLAGFLSVAANSIPRAPDALPDPKQTLVNAAAKSRKREVREGVAPATGSTAKQGPTYNSDLGRFVREQWDLQEASGNSNSLARAVAALERYAPST